MLGRPGVSDFAQFDLGRTSSGSPSVGLTAPRIRGYEFVYTREFKLLLKGGHPAGLQVRSSKLVGNYSYTFGIGAARGGVRRSGDDLFVKCFHDVGFQLVWWVESGGARSTWVVPLFFGSSTTASDSLCRSSPGFHAGNSFGGLCAKEFSFFPGGATTLRASRQ